MEPASIVQPTGKPTVISFPGLEATVRLLHRQQDLLDRYHVQSESYPQDRPQTYEELADHAADVLKADPSKPAKELPSAKKPASTSKLNPTQKSCCSTWCDEFIVHECA